VVLIGSGSVPFLRSRTRDNTITSLVGNDPCLGHVADKRFT